MLIKRRDPSATPTLVSPQRAKELLVEMIPFHISGDRSSLTPGEDNYIRAEWEKKPGHWNYMMTLVSIANPEKR